ncbi:carbon storage regulator CsrA [Paenibacillus lignilyticus]|uniref:Translational regulator CsrA n=1 Tax=Paenibacillus lignilyticus TaxID=1172615 RepID=A0ABS5CLM5_9BACL|nr:carbon storage regulator CsrA [Paenibacillus lignilyticus]MBP3966771.1 carbon storage regulator CsrA [Paenibacillus lignilyticus]
MLILSRKKGQSILLNNDIEIVISSIDGDQVKVGIKAPSDVNILRKEVYDAVQESNKQALQKQLNLADLKSFQMPNHADKKTNA